MSLTDKFAAIRKGLLEFLILKIVAADKVYVADILAQLSDTDFATPNPVVSGSVGVWSPQAVATSARMRSVAMDSRDRDMDGTSLDRAYASRDR